ncbi:MAG: contractile injection system protein, VgrG/Pvc8 family [Myxococcota bacterium]
MTIKWSIEAGPGIGPDEISSVTRVQVTQPRRGPARARLHFAARSEGRTWRPVDSEWAQPGVDIRVGLTVGESGKQPLIDGFVTDVRLGLPPDGHEAFVEVDVSDSLWLLDRAERVQPYPDKTLKDIVGEIIGPYELGEDVEVPDWTSEENREQLIQRASDRAFLMRLARRFGLELFVEPGADSENPTLHLHPMRLGPPEEPALAAHAGNQTTLREVEVLHKTPSPGGVRLAEVSALDKGWSLRTGKPSEATFKSLGEVRLDDEFDKSLGTSLPPSARDRLKLDDELIDATETAALNRAGRGAFSIEARASLVTAKYGGVLRPHRVVSLRNLGTRHSGDYYVSEVEHDLQITGEGGAPDYQVHFTAIRNAVGPSPATS